MILLTTCVCLAASAALAGCGAAAHRQATLAPATTPSATRAAIGTADWYCLNAGERREMLMLRGPGHDRLAALTIGTGRVTVVLAHHASGSLCQWWPYARSLAAAGYRVVAFDFDGCGASPPGDGDYPGEVAAAAEWARGHGARQIVLMGGSMGGTAVIVAAARLGASITGVIDLSGPAAFASMDALGAARRVRVPVLFGYGTQDGAFAEGVQAVRAATASHDKPVVTVPGGTHGAALVDPEVGYPSVRDAVLRFIRAATRS